MNIYCIPCRKLVLIYFFLVLCLCARPASFIPVITNYSSTVYNGGLQNWSVTQGDNGEIYIGNNNGVLVYDGYTWHKWAMPGNAIVRSVFYDHGRLYVGSQEEFGYMTRNKMGEMTYHSLWKQLRGYQPHNDEIWKILKTKDNKIIFQSFCSWFEYDGHRVQAHYNAAQLPLYFFNIKGTIYVQLVNGPLCILHNNKYIPLISRKHMGGDGVVAAMPLAGSKILLCTEFHGLYVLEGKRVSLFHVDNSSQLLQAQANRAVITRDGKTIVVGTIMDGIFGYDRLGHLLWHYNKQNRLGNNTVLMLYCDRNNNIWAALDIGIALIHNGAPYSQLTDNTVPMGMVYDIFLSPTAMYLATNQNAYCFSQGVFQPIAGTSGQNWHVSYLGNQLIVGNNHGAKLVKGLSATLIPGSDQASSTAIRRLSMTDKTTDEYLIESSYTKFRVYQDKKDHWIYRNALAGFVAPVRQFEIDNNGVIWAANMTRGFYRIELSSDLSHIVRSQYIPALDKSRVACNIHITRVFGSIVFSDGNHTYRLGDNDKIVPYPQLQQITGGDISSSARYDQNRYWIATSRGYILIAKVNRRLRQLLYIPATFFNTECSDNMNKVYVSGNMAYLCMDDGVGRVDMRRIGQTVYTSKLQLVHAEYINSGNETVSVPVDDSDPAVKGTMRVLFSYPNYSNIPLQFEYKLEGASSLDIRSDRPFVSFNDLSYGDYVLTASVKDMNGKVLDVMIYHFHHARPFYLSWIAFLLYFLILGITVYLYIRWKTMKIIRKNKHIAENERIKQNLKLTEQQRIIEEQQKLILEKQLQDKSKKIASLTINSLRQNQQVKEMKEELSNNHSGKLTKDNIYRMLNHITDDIDNDTYWDMYQKNFDLIHKNFFRNLRKINPELTATDLKFCALLRLNRSTKEIALFTGLTTRGVEGARYRLRKKLDIPKGQSIVQFLLTIN